MKELFDFSKALIALKKGEHIARNGWNGKGLSISMKDEYVNKADITMGACLYIFNKETNKADTWVPSISDLFAEDWHIV